MKYDRIKYTGQFDYYGISEWIGAEGQLEEGESIEDAILQTRERIRTLYKEKIGSVPIIKSEKITKVSSKEQDDKTNSELELCHKEISSSLSQPIAEGIAKKHGFHLHKGTIEFIYKKFS